MFWNNNLGRVALAVGILVLAGCSSNQPKPEEAQAPTSAAATSASADAKPLPAPLAPVKPAAIVPNPSTVPFQKMTVALDDKARQQLAQLADRAKSAGKVTLIGYCDRTQVANPTDAAVARAIAVRDELQVLGVQPGVMQVRIDTRNVKKHAVEVRFD